MNYEVIAVETKTSEKLHPSFSTREEAEEEKERKEELYPALRFEILVKLHKE